MKKHCQGRRLRIRNTPSWRILFPETGQPELPPANIKLGDGWQRTPNSWERTAYDVRKSGTRCNRGGWRNEDGLVAGSAKTNRLDAEGSCASRSDGWANVNISQPPTRSEAINRWLNTNIAISEMKFGVNYELWISRSSRSPRNQDDRSMLRRFKDPVHYSWTLS